MESLGKITTGLDTPIKRGGFIILLVGVVLTVVGALQLGFSTNSYNWLTRFLSAWGEALVFDRRSYRHYPLASIGPYVLIAGLTLSYFYDRTVGRLVAWIHRGSTPI